MSEQTNPNPDPNTLPEFTPTLAGFRAEEFLTLTESLLAFPLEQNKALLDAAPFRLKRPEPRPEPPLPPLPPRWYPRHDPAVIEAARERLKPPPRTAIFEGRANEITRVLRPLLSGSPVRVLGEPGIGKTALLAQVALHERTRQRFRRVWWFDSPDQIDQTLALALNLPHVIAEPDPARRRAWLAGQLDDNTLLVIDQAAPGDLDLLAHLTPNMLIAIDTAPMTLDPDADPLEPSADPEGIVTLRALEDTTAIDTLALYAGIEDTRRIRGPLLRIVTMLGGHPYALMLAGTLMRRDGVTLDEMENLLTLPDDYQPVGVIHELPRPKPDDEDEENSGTSDEFGDAAPPHLATLNRALDVSFEGLPRSYQRLFETFGAFPISGAPFDGLNSVARIGSDLATRRGLIMLADYGFIRRDHRDPDFYTMHPVAYARAVALDAEGKTAQKMLRWAARYARDFAEDHSALYHAGTSLQAAQTEADNATLIPYLRAYVPGMVGVYPPDAGERANGPRAEAARLTRTGLDLTDDGAAHAAEEALNRALELRRAHDSDHAIAEALVALGRLHDLAGRTDRAAALLVEAAELVYKLGADDSLSVIRRGLARVYRHMGQLNEALGVLDDAAEAHFERAAVLRAMENYDAAVAEMALADDDVPYVRAETFVLAGRYADALAALADEDDPDSAHLRAQIFHLQGSVDEAIRGYESALERWGDEAAIPTRAKILRGLGAAFASGGRYDDAREAFESALAVHERDEKPDPALVGRTLRLLAAAHFAAGRVTEAIAAAREALKQFENVAAPDDAAYAYRTLGRALWSRRDYAGAREAFEHEVEQTQSLSKRDDVRIGIGLHHLADAYRATNEAERAIANYRRALTHKNADVDPGSYLITQLALHRILTETGRHSAALDVAQESVDLLTGRAHVDLQQLGYTQALRARSQQAVERPIRALQSLGEWTRTLAARANEAISDPRPALPALALGLAARSLLAEDRPALALHAAELGHAHAAAHFAETPAGWAAVRDLGEAYFALNQTEEAIITLEPLLDVIVQSHAATFALAHALTGRAYHRLGDIGSALDHLEIAFAHEPDDHLKSLVQEEIAAIQLEVGQPVEAVASLREALPLINRADHPDVLARCLTTLAHTLGGLNRYAEAIGVYEDALNALRQVAGVAPTHTADVLRSLGRTHEAQGQRSEASQAYRRALNLLERTDAPRQTRDILHELARITAEMGDQSAVQLYEQVRDATAQVGEPGELGNVLRELADVHRDGGRLPLAVQNYQAALDHQPAPMLVRDRIATLRNLGRALAQMERYDDARTAWTEALDLSYDLPDASPVEIGLTHFAIAEAHRQQKHYDNAERSYREALQHHAPLSVDSAITWRRLGQALHAAGHLPEAIEALQKALEAEKAQPQQVNARLVETLQLLARAQEDTGNLDAAIARYHEALVYMDRSLQAIRYADTLRTLGQLYAANHNYPQAFKALHDALTLEGDYVPRSDDRISRTLQLIAETHRAAGDLEKAAEFYQQVTVYANYARRVSDDLRDTLGELDRRRATLQAAEQSLALLSRSDTATVKDIAFVHALIAHAHARLNQPQQAADAIRTLLNVLDERGEALSTEDRDGDTRALAWLFTASDAERADDIETAQFACGAALDTVRNVNLRWVIEQWARSLAG